MATRMVHAKEVRDDGSIVEIVVWLLDSPIPPCRHSYKYRLFFGTPEQDYIRYDNERGKGDHCHIGNREAPYQFISVARLLADFQQAIEVWEEP